MFGFTVENHHGQRNVERVVLAVNPVIDLALLVLGWAAPVAPYAIHPEGAPPRAVRVVGFGCIDEVCRHGAGRRTYFDAWLNGET